MELIFTQHNNSNYYKCALNNLNYMRRITTLKKQPYKLYKNTNNNLSFYCQPLKIKKPPYNCLYGGIRKKF